MRGLRSTQDPLVTGKDSNTMLLLAGYSYIMEGWTVLDRTVAIASLLVLAAACFCNDQEPCPLLPAIRVSRALFSFQKILQNFSDFLSHQIFRRMHKVLNIDKNKN